MKFILPIGLLVSTICLNAQEMPLKVSEVVKKAYAHYPSVSLSNEYVKSAQYSVENAQWSYYPTPSVEVSARDGKNYETAKLEQPLWTGGKLSTALELAEIKKDEMQISQDVTKYDLTENILNSLGNYLQAKNNIRILQNGKKRLEQLSEMIDRRIESGVSSSSDKELLQARINQLESDIITSQNKLEIALLKVENYTGEKITDVEFEYYLETLNKPSHIYIEDLKENNPTLKKMQFLVKAAAVEIEQVKSSIYPNLSLKAEYQKGALYDDVSTNDNAIVYVSLTATTGAGLSILSKIKIAEVKAKQITFEQETKQKELIDKLLNDLNEYKNINSQIKNREERITYTSDILDSYTRLFMAGKKQWLDLVNMSKELTSYESELVNLQSNEMILRYKLALQTGRINFETGDFL